MGALAYYITNMLQMLHKNRKKLTKKYSPVKALLVFGHPSSVKLPGQVVDGNNLVTFSAEHLTERKTTNAAEAIDSNFYH